MRIDVRSTAPLKMETPCLVAPVWQGAKLDGATAKLDRALSGLVAEVMAEDGFKGSAGETRVLYTGVGGGAGGASGTGGAGGGKIGAARVLLLGLGRRDKMTSATLRKAAARAARGVRAIKRAAFALALPPLDGLNGITPEEIGAALAEGIVLGLHVFHDFKTDEETRAQTKVASATLLAESGHIAALRYGVERGQRGAEANLRARHLVNLPSNKKSPQFLAEQAQQIAEANGLRCEVWDEARILEEKMGALHAVGMGSDNPPRFIVLEYAPPGHESDAPLALVGKGMTFDTGGYSLKPAASMEDMKDDMAGAAVVLGAMSAIGALRPARRVLGLMASAENMVNGHAQRPGDIVTARNGKTIEVLNTDAEGRLILADALSYATEQKPAAILDFATLTGAIGIALGQEAAGLFSNDGDLARQVRRAGEASGDRVWEFPMWDEYKEHVRGTVSDLKNIGIERRAGSIAGAVFLENFVGAGIPWAHLDIAAVALVRDDRPLVARGATGFGVGLALEFLRNYESAEV